MSEWQVEYISEALDDLKSLDGSQQKLVLKAIKKVSRNPLPITEGGLGKPLGNRSSARLMGFQIIKLKRAGLRIVYRVVKEQKRMRVIIISVRDDDQVYKLAQDRVK